MKSFIAALMVAVALSPLAGCQDNPVTGKRQLVLISTEEEIAMGREAAPEFEKEFGGKVPDEALQDYVSAIGQRVAARSDRQEVPYRFGLLASGTPNAFALPGGAIYVTAGLMQVMENERELAAVLGHEVGHVAARHNVQGMQRQMTVAVLAEVAGAAVGGSGGQAAEVATQVVGSMMNLKYSREQELAADRYGTVYLAESGYNPWGMVEMLATLKSLSEREPGALENMFSTHPATGERIKEAEDFVEDEFEDADRDAPDPHAARFREMRAELPQYIKKTH